MDNSQCSYSEGPQQGDPLGPLMFSNTVQPLLVSLTSELTLGYLDDLTLGGLPSQVAKDINPAGHGDRRQHGLGSQH